MNANTMCADDLQEITSRGRVISFSLLRASERLMLGFNIGLRAYVRHLTLIKQLQLIISELEGLRPHIEKYIDEPKTRELISHLVPQIVRRIDVSIDIAKIRGRLFRREMIVRQLSELRESFFKFWEDYEILLDKELVESLLASKKRTDAGKVISHDEFWKQVDVHS